MKLLEPYVPPEAMEFLKSPMIHLLLLIVVFGILAMVAHRVIMVVLTKLAAKTENDWDDLWLIRVRKPLYVGLLATALSFALEFSQYKFSDLKLIQGVLKGAFILSMFWCLERLLFTLLQKGVLLKTITPGARNFLGTLARVMIMMLAVLMVLDSAGISITPLLASLGVGSLAVALALQDTLSNFFSGIYILADKPFGLQDFIRLESGDQGRVEKIGWRSTHLRLLSNNVLVIPNSKIATGILTNYDLIESDGSFSIDVGVAYGADLAQVERVVIEVAKTVLASVDGGVTSEEPVVRFKEFGESSVNFSLSVEPRNLKAKLW